MKKVAAYDLDPSNGGLIKYTQVHTDPFLGAVPIRSMGSVAEFFVGKMLDGEPDAIVLDLPGNPINHFGKGMTKEEMITMFYASAAFNFMPVPVYPVTQGTLSTDSLQGALASFPEGPFGVCLNERGVSFRSLEKNEGFSSYSPLAERVRLLDGQEFRLPGFQGDTMKHAIDNLMMPFEVGFPVSADGRLLERAEMHDEISEWLLAQGSSTADVRVVSFTQRAFLKEVLPQLDIFINYVDLKMAQIGAKPVFMPYSDKGGEGKSLLIRLLQVYLRRYWANGIRYMNQPLA